MKSGDLKINKPYKNGFVIAISIALAIAVTFGAFYKAFKIVRHDVASVKADVASVKADVASVKADVASVKDFIPPLYGARHIEVRKFFIYAQAKQLKQNFVLIAGDSITEALFLPRLFGAEVLNGGLGGGGLVTVQEFLNTFPGEKKPAAVLIAIGVNDAVRRETTSAFSEKWENTYRSVVSKAKAISPRVAVSTIIPVEAGKPMGDQYFDPSIIASLNAIIRKVAKDQKVLLIENDPAFSRLANKGLTYTVDGVHLNELGYETWSGNILDQFKETLHK